MMKILPMGDSALTVEFGSEISGVLNDEVNAFAYRVRTARIHGVRELLPTYRSLTVFYDPFTTTFDTLRETLTGLDELPANTADTQSTSATAPAKHTVVHIPCCYGGEYGPDLADLAKAKNISEDEAIRIHSAVSYRIYMIGFLPGFPYLGGLDPVLAMPRLETPRTAIPAGSVGIGGSQTGIYPIASPGGWRLIGKTPVKLYDPSAKEPVLCSAGEFIRFEPITDAEYQRIEKDVEAGSFHVEITTEQT